MEDVKHDFYFCTSYGEYGALRVDATQNERTCSALVIGMMVVGQDRLAFRIKTQRPDAKKVFAYMIIDTLDAAIIMAKNEAELALASDEALLKI